MFNVINYLILKIKIIRNLNWKWAYKYYKKRFNIYFCYYFSKIRGRKYWVMDNIKFCFFHPYHHHMAKIYHEKKHEAHLLKIWENQVKECDLIFDLGGYNGIFGLIAGAANHNATVYIFEPDPINYEHIRKNISLNKLDNIIVKQMVISDNEGIINWRSSFVGGGGTSGTITDSEENFRVETTILDKWIDKPALIKCDIEGAEYRALLGAKNSFQRFKIKMLLEVHENYLSRFGDTEEDIWKLLEKWGYDHLWLDKEDEFSCHYWIYKSTIL